MIKGVKTVTLTMYEKHGKIDRFGDVSFGILGDNINDGCYVSELRTGLYKREFKLTSSELATIEKLAKELVDSKHYEYTLDIIKGTITKS